jgi:hypothetical protein
MKKKLGTVVEETILVEAKERAAREGRPLAELFQDALSAYIHGDLSRGDAERACRLFCSQRSRLTRQEIEELLKEDLEEHHG